MVGPDRHNWANRGRLRLMQKLDWPKRSGAIIFPDTAQQEAALIQSWRRVWFANLGLAALLLAILLITGLRDLDALVTPDEPLWVARSANFYQALSSGDYEDTYQAAHPGVVTMWLGTLAYWLADPDLPERMGRQIETDEVRERVVPPGELPIDTLTELRTAMVLANALLVVVLFFCLLPLVGRLPAFLASAFLSLDPLHIGFTRLLHQDGLSANLLVLAVVAWCWRLQTGSRSALAISGIAAGLALLTRSVNGVLVPLLVLLTLVDMVMAGRSKAPGPGLARRHGLSLLTWGVIALVTVFALWPALWVAPNDTLDSVIRGGSDLASAPHQRQVLFQGEIITGDPGWLFYPIVLAYRMSPVTLIGLGLAAVALCLRNSAGVVVNRRLIWSLAGFAGAYLVILTLAAKKLDRYLLPSLAALDLVAALGAVAVISWLAHRVIGSSRAGMIAATAAGGAILLIGQAVSAIGSAPYYLTYVSPLMGGATDARDEISLGWGEGGKAVAEALLEHPEIGPSNAVGSLWPRTIDYYLPYELGQATHELTSDGVVWFMDSQFVVVTEPEIRRQFYRPSMSAWFTSQEPVFTVADDGRIYARVYNVANDPVPEPYYLAEAPMYAWGEVRLVAATFRSEIEPGMDLRLRLFFETTGAPFDYRIGARVVDEAGKEIGNTRKRIHAEEPVGPDARTVFDIVLPADIPLGTYTIRMSIRNNATDEQMVSVHAVTGDETERSVVLGTFTVVPEVAEPVP